MRRFLSCFAALALASPAGAQSVLTRVDTVIALTTISACKVGTACRDSVQVTSRTITTRNIRTSAVFKPGSIVPVPQPPDTTTPTPPVGGAFTPNLPAGLSLIVDTRFGPNEIREVGQPLGTSGLQYTNWEKPPAFQSGSSITVTGAPWGTTAFETRYPGNSLGNGTGGAGITGPTGQKWRRVYFALSLWVSPNYSVHTGAEKFIHLQTTAANDPTINGLLSEFVVNEPPNVNETPNGPTWGFELCPNLNLFLPYPLEGGGTWGWLYQHSTAPRFRKGVYQTLEVSIVMNAPGQQNGTFKAWIDGKVAADWSGLTYRGGSAQGYIDGIRFDGTRGGGASSTPTPASGQARRYNRLAWYASN